MGRVGGAGLIQFMRFCAVGAVGFAVDASMLLLAVHVFGIGPIEGRLVSFLIAVLTTFELNRRWAFRAKGRALDLAALTSYLGVQGFGFGCNFGIYTLLYLTLPPRYQSPLFCLTVASASALVVNYIGANFIVFRTERAVVGPTGFEAAGDPVAPAPDADGGHRPCTDAGLARPRT